MFGSTTTWDSSPARLHGWARPIRHRGRRRPACAPLAGLGALLTLATACTTTECPLPATRDQLGGMLEDSIRQSIQNGFCSLEGRYFPSSPEAGAPIYTGWSHGSAGIALSLIEGVQALEAVPSSPSGSEPGGLDLADTLVQVSSAADWLAAQARISGTGGEARWWPRCVEILANAGGTGAAACGQAAPPAVSHLCDEAEDAARTGLADGVAGIGWFYLELLRALEPTAATCSESPVPTAMRLPGLGPETADAWLEAAVGAGEWLLQVEEPDGEGGRWAEVPESMETPRYWTSLSGGTAGVAYFLLELHATTCDVRYLEAAHRAGLWLRGLLVPVEGEDALARAPVSPTDGSFRTGFLSGNAGIAYVLLSLSQSLRQVGRTEHAQEMLEAARAIYDWLASLEVRVARTSGAARYTEAALTGSAWLLLPDRPDCGQATDLQDGAAGIGWSFLQAGSGIDPGYTALAEEAGRWLSSGLVGRQFRCQVFWPSRLEPWREAGEARPEGCPDAPTPSEDTGDDRSVVYYSGLRRGGAGIATFLLTLDEARSDACAQAISDQAAEWTFRNNRAQDSACDLACWPDAVTRAYPASDLDGSVTSGLYDGLAGVTSFLAQHRLSTLAPDADPGRGPLGFRTIPALPDSSERTVDAHP